MTSMRINLSNHPQWVLLIGGAGYIGSVLTRRMLATGLRVRVLDRLLYDNGESIADVFDHPNFQFIRGDFRDQGTIEKALDQVGSVVQLAALVGDPICKKYQDEAKDINRDGLIRMLELPAMKAVERFVFLSTCSNYGLQDDDTPVTEEGRLNPVSLYAETKVAVERYLLDNVADLPFSPTILRLSTAFGLSPRMRFDLTVSEFTRDLALGKDLLVYDEKTWRPYAHVQDISRTIETVLASPEQTVRGQVFNVGDDANNYTKQMIVQRVKEVLPEASFRFKEGGMDPRNYRVSFKKLRDQLGITADYTVGGAIDTLARMVLKGLYLDTETRKNYYGNYEIRMDS